MFKKYKAFMNNEGAFEQPGARALQEFITTHNQHVQMEHAALALKTAQKRVREAEEAAREAEARAVAAELEVQSRSSGSDTTSRGSMSLLSRGSVSESETQSLIPRLSYETVLRERLFPEQAPPPTKPGTSESDTESLVPRLSHETVRRARLFPERAPPPTKPVPPITVLMRPDPTICSICSAHCLVCPNPWQRTRRSAPSDHCEPASDWICGSDLMVADSDRPKPVPYGIVLKPCDHVFCGVCLAQEIYHSLNMAFDSATYGTKLPSYAHDVSPERPDFPVSCPTCRVKKEPNAKEISDATARLVLGESNMEEWNRARFASTLRLLQCPHRNCGYTFDTDDAIRSKSFPCRETCVLCPNCRGPLCMTCRSVWHEDMTCLIYQALPRNEKPPGDVRKRHGWAPTLHTHAYSARSDSSGSEYSQRSTPSLDSMHSLYAQDARYPYDPESSAYSPNSPYTPASPYTPSPRDPRTPPPWAHEKSYLTYI
ncbi:hypothetical protein C8R45DRAFT_269514 [Mycena sanguinolenta]|nr:hypothetical protein C8R45DRAFT_269514 [Mycena sanguinolenta]